MRIVTCRCERTFDAELPDEIDLDSDPSVLDEILEGNFLTVTCPHCGHRLKPDIPVSIRSRRRGLDIKVLPEGERSALLDGRTTETAGVEFLVGYPELYERALVIREGLDPGAVEVLKYYILAKALESAGASSDPIVSFRGRTADNKLSFGIAGLRDEEVAILALPYDHYEKACKNLASLAMTEPFSTFLSGPYRSVRALEAR